MALLFYCLKPSFNLKSTTMVSFTMQLLRVSIVSILLFRSSVLGVVVPRQSEITEDSYFYGQSPPVYPTRMFLSPF